MKPSKDLDEILNHLMQYSFDYGKGKISPISNDPPLIIARQAKQQLLTLIEQREREARIKEAKFIYENYFDGEEFHPSELVEHIESLQKGKL